MKTGSVIAFNLAYLLMAEVVIGDSLHDAVRSGNVDAVKVLVKDSPDRVDDVDNQGYTALWLAAEAGYKAIVESLLDAGANPDIICEKVGTNALMVASANGRKAVVQVLLEHGVNVNARESLRKVVNSGLGSSAANKGTSLPSATRGMSALHYSAMRGQMLVTEMLLTHNADICAEDTGGLTPLIWASLQGYPDVVRVLLKSEKCEVNHEDDGGKTALDHAAQPQAKTTTRPVVSEVDAEELRKLLLEHGAKPGSGRHKNRPSLPKDPIDLSASRLHEISQNLLLYSIEHKNLYPPSLEALRAANSEMLADTFESPFGTPGEMPSPLVYRYFTGKGPEGGGDMIDVYDAVALESVGSTSVLFHDGHVKWLSKEEFEKSLARSTGLEHK